MAAYTQLLLNIMQVSLMTAAITIPAISIAYSLIDRKNIQNRMRTLISFAGPSALMLLISALIAFCDLLVGWDDNQAAFAASSIFFIIGCILLILALLMLVEIRSPFTPLSPDPVTVPSTQPSQPRDQPNNQNAVPPAAPPRTI